MAKRYRIFCRTTDSFQLVTKQLRSAERNVSICRTFMVRRLRYVESWVIALRVACRQSLLTETRRFRRRTKCCNSLRTVSRFDIIYLSRFSSTKLTRCIQFHMHRMLIIFFWYHQENLSLVLLIHSFLKITAHLFFSLQCLLFCHPQNSTHQLVPQKLVKINLNTYRALLVILH